MHIEHVAVWTKDLESMKDFYVKYFNMSCNDKYTNSKKGFHSYFLSWAGSRSRIELTERLRTDGYTIAGETRWSGDGYYESVVLDPERNRVEITI